MAKVKLAAVNFLTAPDKAANLAQFQEYIEKAAAENVNILVFPELSLTGMHPQLSMMEVNQPSAKYFYDNAELVPEGPSVQTLIGLAKKYDMYLAWSMVEADPVYTYRFYNTEVLVGPEGFVGKYRKIHQPGTERMTLNAGEELPVFDTKYGKVGLQICFDKMFPEGTRCLRMQGADIILISTAWPAIQKAEDDSWMLLYKETAKLRAAENSVVWVEASNVSPAEQQEYVECGHSCILGPDGSVKATTGFEEGVAVAELDPAEEIHASESLFVINRAMMDIRPDLYAKYYEDYDLKR